MNAYERREEKRKAKRRAAYLKRAVAITLMREDAERYYEDAFLQLQGKYPLVIPKMSVAKLIHAAEVMWARLHELELGE